VIEELLVGREASFFVLSDGTRSIPLGSAEDHKRAPTATMGRTPAAWARTRRARGSIRDRSAGDERDRGPGARGHAGSEGSEFRGFLFVGLMLTETGRRSSSSTSGSAIRKPR
jgi:phosphoribosylamine--glycine ligase